jgi:SPP1 gp7 family putative phage head morphogenesis protein
MTMMTKTALTSPTGRDVELTPVRPNASIGAEYRKRLDRLVADMHRSLLYWLKAQYRATPPVAADEARTESPAMRMRRAMDELSRQWLKNFDDGADNLAHWFAQKTKDYSDVALTKHLADAGFSVKFKMTAAMNDAYQASIGEQVGLIRSIAERHLTNVETMVMQSVQQGRDLGTLAKQLEQQYGVTKRRAALIARDQNNKATAIMQKTRQRELGIKQAIWCHSGAGKTPRPSHVKAGREKLTYDVDKGAYIDGKWIWPGTEINCRCFCRPVIPGFKP